MLYTPNRLLLIDGLNLVRRVYEAQPTEDSPEKANAAVRSSIASFKRALKEHNPTHVLAAFDFGGPNWRHRMFEGYREARRPMPDPLKAALPELYEKLEELGVPIICVPDVEADDVIAKVFKHWNTANKGPAIIVSTDKDLAALIAEGALVWDHFSKAWRDDEWLKKKFDVTASQLHDLLALMGDSTDGVPGVPGVGPKTAAKWLNQYGSLDQLIEHAAEVPGKIGETLRANIEVARRARELVGFKTDFTLGLTWGAIRYTGQPIKKAA